MDRANLACSLALIISWRLAGCKLPHFMGTRRDKSGSYCCCCYVCDNYCVFQLCGYAVVTFLAFGYISSGSQLGLLWDPACVMQRPAPDTEPPRKKLRMATGTVWSWPKRVDEIAAGLGPCLAATDGACEITWAQLAQRSKVAAKSLQKLGFSGSPTSAYRQTLEQEVIAQAPMVVMLPHGVDTLVIILGVLRQALPLLPLSISHGNRKQLLQRYEDAMMLFEPVAAITDSEMARELRQFREVKVISARGLLVGEAEDFQDVETTTDHALAYIFTSGSTGKSKCVTLTNRMAWAECQWYPELFEKLGYRVDPRKDRWRLDHEMGWWGAAFFGEVDVALAMAMPIVIMKPTDPDWAKQQVTVSGALPSQLRLGRSSGKQSQVNYDSPGVDKPVPGVATSPPTTSPQVSETGCSACCEKCGTCWESCLTGKFFGFLGACVPCWGFFLLGWLFTLLFFAE
ncbi:unnamed protein product, partial [Effrenium voratum]